VGDDYGVFAVPDRIWSRGRLPLFVHLLVRRAAGCPAHQRFESARAARILDPQSNVMTLGVPVLCLGFRKRNSKRGNPLRRDVAARKVIEGGGQKITQPLWSEDMSEDVRLPIRTVGRCREDRARSTGGSGRKQERHGA